MQYLEARTMPTSGAGYKCLFNALQGVVGRDGLLADGDGQAAALRMRAGALMRDAFISLIIPFFIPGGYGEGIAKWVCEERITKCLKCLEAAKTSVDTRDKILKDGLRRAAGTK